MIALHLVGVRHRGSAGVIADVVAWSDGIRRKEEVLYQKMTNCILLLPFFSWYPTPAGILEPL